MFTEDLDELEVAILLKRLEILKAQGITGRRVFSLGDDFFALMKDKWIFDGVLSTIHGFQEMHDEGRDEAVWGYTGACAHSARAGKEEAWQEE